MRGQTKSLTHPQKTTTYQNYQFNNVLYVSHNVTFS
jgi:hypothetical protein